MRHLNPFQCEICGKRFGKRYGKGRHIWDRKSQCMPVEESGSDKVVVWVSQELEAAVKDLEEAKGYVSVTAAIDKCKQLCCECAPQIVHQI